MMNLKEMFQLSDRGAKDLKKGIFACTLTNLSLMLSVVITVQIFWEVLTPLTGGAVSWSKMDAVWCWCCRRSHPLPLLQK